jgi:2-keto-4-pentenoate hydratase
MDRLSTVAAEIFDAYRSKRPIEPIRGRLNGTSEAYAVQKQNVGKWLATGRREIGRKIGLTSKAVQQQLAVDEPDYGVLFEDMLLRTGSTVKRGSLLQPRIEGEIAFVLSAPLRGTHITPQAVVAALDYVCPAIEICDSRIARWDIKIEDTIADNASSGLVVLGDARIKPTLEWLSQVEMTVHSTDGKIGEGRGDACLGNPAIAVAWLAEKMTELGDGLRAGDLIMSGALSKMTPALPGNQFRAEFRQFGAVSITFAQ